MNVILGPSALRFIDEQVKAGRYLTPDAVIEAAIAEVQEQLDNARLDDLAVAAIQEAEKQADRGEGMDLDTFRAGFQHRDRSGFHVG